MCGSTEFPVQNFQKRSLVQRARQSVARHHRIDGFVVLKFDVIRGQKLENETSKLNPVARFQYGGFNALFIDAGAVGAPQIGDAVFIPRSCNDRMAAGNG